MEKINQDHIDASVANTEEFWTTYHKSLNAPYHPHHEFRNNSISEWVNSVKQNSDMVSYLEHFLFNFPVLKGETFLTLAEAMTLTNYRLIMNDANIGITSIPLGAIVSCEKDKVVYLINGQTVTLNWNRMNPELVNAAISRGDFKELDEVKNSILESNFYDLGKNESLVIPKISWNESLKLIVDKNNDLTSGTFKNYNGNSSMVGMNFKEKFLFFFLAALLPLVFQFLPIGTLDGVDGLYTVQEFADFEFMAMSLFGTIIFTSIISTFYFVLALLKIRMIGLKILFWIVGILILCVGSLILKDGSHIFIAALLSFGSLIYGYTRVLRQNA